MAVRNEAANIDEQLGALARQTHSAPWELVVVDNASDDGTRERALAWCDRIPGLRVVVGPPYPSRSAPQNAGVTEASGDVIAFCDGDDVVSDGWVAAMAAALADHPHVTGPVDLTRLNRPERVWGEHVERWAAGPPQFEFLPFAWGGNSGWRREVFEALGGFDESLKSGHDVDLSWRAQLANYELWFEPAAVVHRRQRSTIGATFLQHVLYGRSNARIYARFKSYGMARRSVAGELRDWAQLGAALPWLVRHPTQLAETLGLRVGRCLPIVRAPRSPSRRC